MRELTIKSTLNDDGEITSTVEFHGVVSFFDLGRLVGSVHKSARETLDEQGGEIKNAKGEQAAKDFVAGFMLAQLTGFDQADGSYTKIREIVK